MAKLLKGAEIAKVLEEKIIQRVEKLKDKGITPCLAILRIGKEQDAIVYEKNILKQCQKIGIKVETIYFEQMVSKQSLLREINRVNKEEKIHGILLVRPLPNHLEEMEICNQIAPAKDIEGVTEKAMVDLYKGKNNCLAPCIVESCIELLNYYQIPLSGKKIVIVGRSLFIGKPLAMLLLKQDATVTIGHSKTEGLQEICKQADILIVGIGKPQKIDSSYVTEGQIVVDIGIHVTKEGEVCGDVKFSEVESKVGAITPVPGGIGRITSTMVAKHVLELAEQKR